MNDDIISFFLFLQEDNWFWCGWAIPDKTIQYCTDPEVIRCLQQNNSTRSLTPLESIVVYFCPMDGYIVMDFKLLHNIQLHPELTFSFEEVAKFQKLDIAYIVGLSTAIHRSILVTPYEGELDRYFGWGCRDGGLYDRL